jgi:hypothetical protein
LFYLLNFLSVLNLNGETTTVLQCSAQDTVDWKKINSIYLVADVDISRGFLYSTASSGEVAERLNAAVLKTVEG